MAIKLLDRAHYTAVLDPNKVLATAVISKATQGTGFVDPTFKAATMAFDSDGFIVGAYCFFDPSQDPIAQADLFAKTCLDAYNGPMLLAVDVEECIKNGVDAWDALTVNQRATQLFDFLGRMQRYYKGLMFIYMGQEFYEKYLKGVDFSAWYLWVPDELQSSIRSGNPRCPDCWKGKWTVWQTFDKDTEAGLQGYADLDAFAGTPAELQALCCVPIAA